MKSVLVMQQDDTRDLKSTRLNSSHSLTSYTVMCVRKLMRCPAVPLKLSRAFCPCYLFLVIVTATPPMYTLSLHDALPIYNVKVALPMATPCGSKRIV